MMYKDPLLSENENKTMQRHIETKLAQRVGEITDESLSDGEFTQALLDVCQLNKMRDSHLAAANLGPAGSR